MEHDERPTSSRARSRWITVASMVFVAALAAAAAAFGHDRGPMFWIWVVVALAAQTFVFTGAIRNAFQSSSSSRHDD